MVQNYNFVPNCSPDVEPPRLESVQVVDFIFDYMKLPLTVGIGPSHGELDVLCGVQIQGFSDGRRSVESG